MARKPIKKDPDALKKNAEVKQLENDYLSLGRELSEIRERGLNSNTFSEHTALFKQKLRKADELAAKAYKTEISKCISMDCDLLANISSFNPQLTDLVETDVQVFSAHDFAEKLILAINPSSALAEVEQEEELESQMWTQASSGGNSQKPMRRLKHKISEHFSIDDLKSFGRDCAAYNNEAATYDFVLGAFESFAPARVERSQRTRIKHNFDSSQRQKPAEANDEEVKDVVTEQVEHLFDHICDEWDKEQQQPVPMIEVLLDKQSFSHTVSNLFHSAFLVKSGSVQVTRDQNGKPVISPVASEEDAEQDLRDKPRNQSVLSFNKQDWIDWVNKVNHK